MYHMHKRSLIGFISALSRYVPIFLRSTSEITSLCLVGRDSPDVILSFKSPLKILFGSLNSLSLTMSMSLLISDKYLLTAPLMFFKVF